MSKQDEERHGLADHLEELLPKLQAKWETGSFRSLEEAFFWCAANGYRFPKWLLDAVRDELAYSKANRPRGGTKKGNSVTAERYERIHRLRHMLVQQFLDFQQVDLECRRRVKPISEIEAARSAVDYLPCKHFAIGTPEVFLQSYKKLKTG